jgi:diaminopimelate decarboxylase
MLHFDGAALAAIADRYGTPCYVYCADEIVRRWREFDAAFGPVRHLTCYAVKASSNIAILNLLAREGAGFDIVSGGELERVLAAGARPDRIVFAGVGKTAAEMRRGLEVGIRTFNVESEAELERLHAVAAELGVIAPVALRVNPDVDPETHPYIATGLAESKFGIPTGQVIGVFRRAAALPHVAVTGLACHIGSQIATLAPIRAAMESVATLVGQLARSGIPVHHVDAGGGLGVRYREEGTVDPRAYVETVRTALAGLDVEILIEPGRAIVAEAGVLLTRVEYLKPGAGSVFAVVDAAMNDLVRPALYDAWHDIVPVTLRDDVESGVYDVVGPICESGDFLGRARRLALRPGDLLAVCTAGAYGFVMSSNYNSRGRAPEIMVRGEQSHLVRPRETNLELFASERMLPHRD